jgi:hypothetical protein
MFLLSDNSMEVGGVSESIFEKWGKNDFSARPQIVNWHSSFNFTKERARQTSNRNSFSAMIFLNQRGALF